MRFNIPPHSHSKHNTYHTIPIMKQLRITVAGQTFDVTVETLGDTPAAAPAPAPVAPPPAPLAPAPPAAAPPPPPPPNPDMGGMF